MKNQESVLTAPAQAGPWRTDEPPQDGKPIVAIGQLMYSDEFSTTAEPFCVALTWGSTQFQDIKTGWHYWHNGMSLASTLEDEVIIHYWLPMPE